MDPTEDVWVFRRSSSRIRKHVESATEKVDAAASTAESCAPRSPKPPMAKRRAEVATTPRSAAGAKSSIISPPRSPRRKKLKTETLHGPAWYMDWVAKGYTWEDAKKGLETDVRKPPPVKAAPLSKTQQIEYEQRRKMQQVNNEAMQAVRQSDGYVDPAAVCRYLIKKSRLDQPYNCLRHVAEDESNAFHFVRNMYRQTFDKENIYASVMTEQDEAAARSKRREENRLKSAPKAIKEQQIRTGLITGADPGAIDGQNPTAAANGHDATVDAAKREMPCPDGHDESSDSKDYIAFVDAPEEINYSEEGDNEDIKRDQESLPRRRGLWK